MNTLFIGGPNDGIKQLVTRDAATMRFAVAPRILSFDTDQIVEPEQHTYRRISLGSVYLYVHSSLTEEQALERLMRRYRKPAKKKVRW